MLDPHPHAANALPMAGEMAVLAERYAGVLYDLAAEGGNLDAVTADMRGLRQIWGECPEWRAVATDPRLMPGEAIAATAAITKASALNTLTGNFIGVVAHNRRLAHLPCIIHFFLRIVAARRGEVNADIRTTQPLSAAQRDALAASLGSIAGGKINLTVIEDASILGGLTVKIGSSLIDASVKTKLDLLERTLIAGAAA